MLSYLRQKGLMSRSRVDLENPKPYELAITLSSDGMHYQIALQKVWAMLLAVLIYVVGAVLIYLRGVEQKPWMGQSVRFGILLALVAVVYGSLSGWVNLPIPHMLAVKWIVCESLLSVVFGLAVAGICKPLGRYHKSSIV
jgi:hypothetical protein